LDAPFIDVAQFHFDRVEVHVGQGDRRSRINLGRVGRELRVGHFEAVGRTAQRHDKEAIAHNGIARESGDDGATVAATEVILRPMPALAPSYPKITPSSIVGLDKSVAPVA
jgi:hypothetical protein